MRQKNSLLKRAALAAMLIVAMLILASCYMEPDRVVDGADTQNNPAQTFESVITPTPTSSPVPTPTSTPGGSVDWTDWTFGNDPVTDPPSLVTGTTPPPSGNITNPPSVGNVTAPPVNVTQTPSGSASGTVTSKVTSKPTATPTSSVLKRGSTGSAVKKLQQYLKDLKYYKGSVDGTFGEGTEDAVKAFQKNNGLTADGVAGTQTLKKLYGNSAKPAPSSGGSSSESSGSSSSSVNNKGAATTAKPSSNYTNGKTNVYLRLGDNGSNVKYMQNRLIELGYLTGTADGSFGASTEAAVMAFQKRNNVYADGVAGPSTLSLLYSNSAKRASGVAGTLGSLYAGDNGPAVRTLQNNLKKLGYYKGSIDGDYGAGTLAAVTAFQSSHGLTADGIAGKTTLNAIAEALSGGSSGSGGSGGSSSKTDPTSYGATASSNGYTTISTTSKTSSSKVTALQSALLSTGFYHGSLDGNFGSSTSAAVSEYQKAAGLRVTGMAGPTTQRLLYGGTGESGSYSKLEKGSSGSKVKQLQYALYELKYYDGKITGTFDSATENAVMVFQEQNGLEIDGVAGSSTQRRLYSSYAVPCN